jgi:uncharacterized YigZ family protein
MPPEDTYRTIAGSSQGMYKEKGSKFIARAYPVYTEEDVKEKLRALRKEFHDARHHCYAYCFGPERSVYRVNDDGEPSGTAGKPIFGQIQSKDITNVLIVVVRYFGGIKLGVPGLINAYRSAARDAIENNTIRTKTVNEEYVVSFEYPVINDIMKTLKEESATILEQDFSDTDCRLRFHVPRASAHILREKFGKIRPVSLQFLDIFREF